MVRVRVNIFCQKRDFSKKHLKQAFEQKWAKEGQINKQVDRQNFFGLLLNGGYATG